MAFQCRRDESSGLILFDTTIENGEYSGKSMPISEFEKIKGVSPKIEKVEEKKPAKKMKDAEEDEADDR
jgi:hypothetical protein